jgi:DNA-binding MarR family transcriptional regulator
MFTQISPSSKTPAPCAGPACPRGIKLTQVGSVAQEVFLSITLTADHLVRGFDELFKPYKLSVTQYNLLRILRFADDDAGLSCKHIGQRMVTREPDLTRLLTRLERRKLISRQRGTVDRRVVRVRITPEGINLLNDLDQPVLEFHNLQFAHLPEADLARIIDILEIIREVDVAPRPPPSAVQTVVPSQLDPFAIPAVPIR